MLKRLLSKEGLAIAAGTMLLYTSVYFFERGYCTRLNIPLDYIEISIPTIANDVLYCLLFILPTAVISMAIMITGERNGFKGLYALSSFYCGLVYAIILFFLMEHTLKSAVMSSFLGGLFFMLLPDKNENKFFGMTGYYLRLIRFSMALFLLSTTFLIYGNSFAARESFDTYSQNGKKYALLKAYGENVFMQEIVNGKRASGITYFNAHDMTGMTLTGN